MSRYAVKIGEIIIVSDKPITAEDRKEVLRGLKAESSILFEDGKLMAIVELKD